MPEFVDVLVNGNPMRVTAGTTVAAALTMAEAWRTSVTGEPRSPLCGMGICFECSASVDSVAHVKTCQILVRPGMVVESE